VNRWLRHIPNGITALRILLVVPIALALLHGELITTIALFGAAAVSDAADGFLAKRFGWQSEVGSVLDPAADRLYIAATIVALAVRGIIPWWLVAVLALRELTVGGALAVLRRRVGFGTLQVSLVGKGATLCLLYAFPLLFLGDHPGPGGTVARVIGWAFAVWGTVLYWWAAALYLAQVKSLISGNATADGANP